MINEILKVSAAIHNGRECKDILCSLAEEVGELGKEVRVKYGPSYKSGDADGILGEAVDVILCAVDMIYRDNPEITSREIHEVIQCKLEKWFDKEQKATLKLREDLHNDWYNRQVLVDFSKHDAIGKM